MMYGIGIAFGEVFCETVGPMLNEFCETFTEGISNVCGCN